PNSHGSPTSPEAPQATLSKTFAPNAQACTSSAPNTRTGTAHEPAPVRPHDHCSTHVTPAPQDQEPQYTPMHHDQTEPVSGQCVDFARRCSAVLTIYPGRSADYLLDAVATGRENYYTGAVAAGEPPGRWYGAGAEALGLSGLVDAQEMQALYEHFLDPRGP